jgi:2-polyprenyl-3-methyl-5-hydroxy-6-metoxy-1,4-benzoquinol methylase
MINYNPYDYSISIFDKYILALQAYTNLPVEEIERRSRLENEFKSKFTSEVIQDELWIRKLYQASDVYMFANPYYYKDNFEKRLEKFWKPIVENPGSVLDYGCGAGTLDELLIRKGIKDITLCDLASPTFAFVKFFFKNRAKYEGNVDELDGRYDWIISNSVLEHIPDPIKVVKMWEKHLTGRGKIIDSMAVDVGGPHLQISINKYNEVEELIRKINNR